MSGSSHTPQTVCRQCGDCCRRGGPALHREDHDLIATGRIPLADLFTIRAGEMVHENVKNRLVPAPSDIIKIRGTGKRWACRYLVENNACAIYDDRPLECRLLECWAPDAVAAVYDKSRLRREDVLASKIPPLWELVQEHTERCDMVLLRRLFDGFSKDGSDVYLKRINDIVQYDRQLRAVLTESGRVAPELFDFLFGRPVADLLEMFGYRLRATATGTRLVPLESVLKLRSSGGPPCQHTDPRCVRTP